MPTKHDPNAPKRPLSAFMCFSTERRKQLQKQHASWTFGEFGKAIGAEWREMPEATRAGYVAASELDQQRYRQEMQGYVRPARMAYSPASGQQGKGKVRRKKDPNAPKRALSPYVFFLKKRRPELALELGNNDFAELVRADCICCYI
eukprot:COSAG01_NODE_2602_length_7394_cov_2.281563_11_plen_147_part_00